MESVIARQSTVFGRLKPPDTRKLRQLREELHHAKLNVVTVFQLQTRYVSSRLPSLAFSNLDVDLLLLGFLFL